MSNFARQTIKIFGKKLAKLAKITNDKKTYLNETGIINIIKYTCKKQ